MMTVPREGAVELLWRLSGRGPGIPEAGKSFMDELAFMWTLGG